jgi:tetraacyldisaccharide 4'-kinase
MGSWVARGLADAGVLHAEKLDSYVISVGNLQAGGAGKTPLVAQIAREGIARGRSVCVLTRGYGGALEHSGGIIPGAGAGAGAGAMVSAEADPLAVGDEVALLHLLVPEAWIAVGSNRFRQYEEATRIHGKSFDVTILDDGFQHWKIKKDRQVLAITSKGPSELLFREFLSQVDRADLLVWTKGEVVPSPLKERRAAKSELNGTSDREIAWEGIAKVKYQLDVPPLALEDRYWLVSGIGDAEAFRLDAIRAGLQVVNELRFEDHKRYSAEEVSTIVHDARTAGCRIALTGKDWVKWRMLIAKERLRQEVLVLEPRLEFESGRELWEKVLWG